jgi:hypothetical protein
MASSASVLDIDDGGDILHVEMTTEEGETIVGVYQLIGWTTPPKTIKAEVERDLWVPKPQKTIGTGE